MCKIELNGSGEPESGKATACADDGDKLSAHVEENVYAAYKVIAPKSTC